MQNLELKVHTKVLNWVSEDLGFILGSTTDFLPHLGQIT